MRLQLADRAGALGQAATVIGLHGGNIVFLDIHRTDGSFAVDDVVVDFGEAPDIAEIQHDLAMNASASLLSYEQAQPGDPVVRGLLLLAGLSEHPDDPHTRMAEALAAISHSDAAWVADEKEASRFEAGKLAIANGQPVVEPATAVPVALAPHLGGEGWLAAVPEFDDVPGRRVAFLIRSGDAAFTATETERVRTLMSAERRISRSSTAT